MDTFIGFLVWAFIIFSIIKKASKKQAGANNTNNGNAVLNKLSSNETVQKTVKSARESAGAFLNTENHSRSHSNSANGRVESKWVADTVEKKPTVHAEENHGSEVHNFTFGDNNRPSALRLYPGDSIPAGYRVVKCSYCAAENLTKGDPCKYSCYFCRELL